MMLGRRHPRFVDYATFHRKRIVTIKDYKQSVQKCTKLFDCSDSKICQSVLYGLSTKSVICLCVSSESSCLKLICILGTHHSAKLPFVIEFFSDLVQTLQSLLHLIMN